MIIRKFLICLIITISLFSCSKCPNKNLKIWFDKPAEHWMTEALPIGNGYMGAMIFGGIEEEHIQFNEESLWTGGPGADERYNYGNRVDAYKSLPEIRTLLAENKFDEAHKLANEKLTGIIHTQNSNMSFGDYGAYQTFGDLRIKVKHQGEVTEYYRDLDISKAIANVKYKAGKVNYHRQFFADYPDQVLVFKFISDDIDGTDYQIHLSSPHKNKTKYFRDNTLIVIGALEDNGMEFESRMLVQVDEGHVEWKNKKIIVSGANELTLFLTAATDYLPQYPQYKGYNHFVCSSLKRYLQHKPPRQAPRQSKARTSLKQNSC